MRSQGEIAFGETCDRIARDEITDDDVEFLQTLVRKCPNEEDNECFKNGEVDQCERSIQGLSIIAKADDARHAGTRDIVIDPLLPAGPLITLSGKNQGPDREATNVYDTELQEQSSSNENFTD